ncbi:MAG: MalY/PatB family protein [Clostridia bacterium]
MDFVHPPELVGGADGLCAIPDFGYTSPTSQYYHAVCGWMERRHHWKIEKEWIVTAPGVVNGFNAAVRALVRPGEGLLVMPPVYPPFLNASEQAGCRRVEVPLRRGRDRYEMDFADLERKAQDPTVKALLFCSPHNPVGRVWTKEELQEVGRICKRCDVTVISDEIHSDIIMPGFEHTTFALAAPFCLENLIVCTAPSKTFNLAGLHTSNIIIPNESLRNAFMSGDALQRQRGGV